MAKHISAEQAETLANDIKNGMGRADVMAKYKISDATFYAWRKRLSKGMEPKAKKNLANGHAKPNRIRDAIVSRLNRDAEFYTRVLVLALE